MSIFVPCSAQKEQDLLDLMFTFTVSLLSLLLNREEIIFDAGLRCGYITRVSPRALCLLALLVPASHPKLEELSRYHRCKSLGFWCTHGTELPEPTVGELLCQKLRPSAAHPPSPANPPSAPPSARARE